MNIKLTGISRFLVLGFALLGLGSLGGCISDDTDPDEDDTGGTGGTSGTGGTTGGSSGSAGTTGGTSGNAGTTGGSGATTGGTGTGGSAGSAGSTPGGTKCASPVALEASKPGITTFDDYVAGTNLATWSFALGGDTSTGLLAGTFGYGDHTDGAQGQPEFFEMVEGNDSTYALSISDTEADDYGGGMGLWLSGCLDATAFTGISFWARGSTAMGDAKLTLMMEETTSNMPATAMGALGTCPGIDSGDTPTCVHPSFKFPVTETWTEQTLAWTTFMPGVIPGGQVAPDGRNIWQIQFAVELVWVDDGTGTYVPTPAPYELAIDTVTFY